MDGLSERLQELDDAISESERAYRLKRYMDRMLPAVLLVLAAVLYLEFFVTLSAAEHSLVQIATRLVLVYFLAELVLDLGIYRNNKKFFREKWVDIVLVLPFFTAFRAIGGMLKSAKGLKAFKLPKAAKLSKLFKGGKVAKHAKKAKEAQHVSKLVKKAKELAE